MENKKELRAKYLKIRHQLSPGYLEEVNASLTQKVIGLIQVNHWQKIGLYFGQNQEVHTKEIIEFCLKNKIQVYLPYLESQHAPMTFKKIQNLTTDLEKNSRFSFQQPKMNCEDLKNANLLEVIFLPVVAFDQTGARIGMGFGYYDQWIIQNQFRNWKIGLAQASQKTAELIQTEGHDQRLNFCLTEKNHLDLRKGKK